MADADKTRAALFDSRKDYHHRFDDMARFLASTGWNLRLKGRHRIFTRPGTPYLLNLQPQPDGKAKAYQIRQVGRVLRERGN